MSSYQEKLDEETELQRRMLYLEGRMLQLESSLQVQRRMLAPVCLVTAGVVLGLASFGLVSGGARGELLGGWTALLLIYLAVMVPLTAATVASRSSGLRGVAAAAWAVIGLMAVCMGAGPRPGLAAALGVAPWYLCGATLITVVGLLRLPTASR